MASTNHRLAAAFQEGKDPQQEAVIQWLHSLPKDARGGVKRSVMKYHLTRALLMYIQSGSDTSAQLVGGVAEKPQGTRVVEHATPVAPVASKTVAAPEPVTVQTTVVQSAPASGDIPVLVKPVKSGGLRSKIAQSMKPS